MSETPPSERTRVKRHPERGAYDRATIDPILDEALFCHVGYVTDGRPRVIPTIHVRVDDTLYIHGSNASRTLRTIKDGEEVCIVTTAARRPGPGPLGLHAFDELPFGCRLWSGPCGHLAGLEVDGPEGAVRT